MSVPARGAIKNLISDVIRVALRRVSALCAWQTS